MIVMKTKDIHIACKRDDGIGYLMERFEISEKEELFEAIRKVTPSGAEELIRRLDKKHKRNERREKTNAGAELTEEESNQTDMQAEQKSEEISDMEYVQETTEEPEGEKQNKNKVLNLEQLKKQEAELSSEICYLEGQHKNLVSRRRELVGALKKAQKALEELRRILREQEKNVTNIYTQYYKCAEQMETIGLDRKACKELLEDTRRQIIDLQKVTILVYQNGQIEVENGENPTISEEESVSELGKLVCMPEAGELTINELKTVAKLQKMVNFFQDNGNTFELVFDSSKVQSFWQTVVA